MMDRVVKFGRTIRNNWKKSVFGGVALYYGAAKVKEQYDINILMRAACKEAAQYGDTLIPMDRNPTLITVILNPVANKRKAKKDYEKYCEPLLHLAGLQVDVIQTTSEGSAKEVVETLRGTEAIIVAGGDGTLLETVTGLLRRNDGANNFPIGILPLGRTNALGETLFPGGKGVERVKQLIKASMAIIKGNTVWKDAMKIEPTETEGEAPNKPIFALTSIEWGVFRDALATRDYYWIYGPLKEYAAFVFNGYKKSLNWECKGTIKYTPPCSGCSNCIEKKPEMPRRWRFFTNLQAATQPENEKANYVNSECLTTQELCFKTCEFKINSPNIATPNDSSSSMNALKVILGKPKYEYTEFVLEGWSRLKARDEKTHNILARTIELLPNITENKKITIGIDQEDFEVKPIKITLLPQIVKMFYDPEINLDQKA